jgi:hypothetical protein
MMFGEVQGSDVGSPEKRIPGGYVVDLFKARDNSVLHDYHKVE